MPFWYPEDKTTIAKLSEGDKFILCRNGLRYKLIEKNFSRSRARVKAIGHNVGGTYWNGKSSKFALTLNMNCHVVKNLREHIRKLEDNE